MPILAAETSIFPNDLLDDRQLDECPVTADRCWWASHTKPRQEKALARELLRFGVSYYLPLVPKDNYIRNRRVRSLVPLFPGYVFLFGTDADRVKALTTNRVCNSLPVVDQQQLRLDLRKVRHLIECGAPLTVEQRLSPGRQVRIKSGLMKGLEGTIIKRRAETRLLVAVNFLQQGASIAVNDFMLEPID